MGDITVQQTIQRLPNGSYAYPHMGKSSETVYLSCCDTEQAASYVYPLNEPRIPNHCALCGAPATPSIDPDKDAALRIAATYELPLVAASFLLKAFRISDYDDFDKFFIHLQQDGLKGPQSLVPYNHPKAPVRRTIHLTQSQQTVSVSCKDCLTTFRVIRIVTTKPLAPQHCMICGSQRIFTYTDPEQDHDEAMANSYGTSVESIKQIMYVFGRSGHTQFGEFVTAYGGVDALGKLCELYVKFATGYLSFEAWLVDIKQGIKDR